MGTRVSKQQVKTPHFFFGQVATKNQFGKELIVVIKKLLRADQYSQWQSGHKLAMQMQKDSLLLAQAYQKQQVKKYFTCCECPADFEMSISYERFDNLYKAELLKRFTSKTFYRQEQVFSIFYELLIGVKEFQRKGLQFGDIRPSQMVVTSSRKIKMINLFSFPWELTSIDKIRKFDNYTKFYLAPQEIAYLNNPSRGGSFPNAKTQAFSLGISILQVSLLENSQDLYVVAPRGFDSQELQRRLTRLENQYPLLKSYVQLLVKEKPEQRLSCGQVRAMLKSHAQSIGSLKPFKQNSQQENKDLQEFRAQGR